MLRPYQDYGATQENPRRNETEIEQASWFSRRNFSSVGNCSRRACWFGCAVRRALCLAVSVQDARKVAAGMRLRIARHLFRRAGSDDFAALIAAFRTKIDQPVRRFDDVKIVFNDQQRCAALQ